MGDFTHFFCKSHKLHVFRGQNFVVAILYLVYFALKYMYFEDLGVTSRENEVTNHLLSSFWKIQEHGNLRISENDNDIQFVTLFSEIREQPSSSPKTQRFSEKAHLIWSIWAPRAPFVIYTPIYIWSHHPVLAKTLRDNVKVAEGTQDRIQA